MTFSESRAVRDAVLWRDRSFCCCRWPWSVRFDPFPRSSGLDRRDAVSAGCTSGLIVTAVALAGALMRARDSLGLGCSGGPCREWDAGVCSEPHHGVAAI